MEKSILLNNFKKWLKYVNEHFSTTNDIKELKEHYIKNEKLSVKDSNIIRNLGED